jgi:hypothetical protein
VVGVPGFSSAEGVAEFALGVASGSVSAEGVEEGLAESVAVRIVLSPLLLFDVTSVETVALFVTSIVVVGVGVGLVVGVGVGLCVVVISALGVASSAKITTGIVVRIKRNMIVR